MADSNTRGQDPPLPEDLSCGKSGKQIYGDRRYLLLMGLSRRIALAGPLPAAGSHVRT
jgi:hypothetical protein